MTDATPNKQTIQALKEAEAGGGKVFIGLMHMTPSDAIELAITPILQDRRREAECIESIIGALASAGFVIVPAEPTEEMIEAGCDSDAYSVAVHENKKRHENLMEKYPDIVKPRDTHGAAPIQTLPIIWRAMVRAALSTNK